MILVGSDDGVYRFTDGLAADGSAATRVLASDRVLRIRRFAGVDGVFAATLTGLYYSPDGGDWTPLDVPQSTVYSVAASPDGDRIYAGTRPARVYVARPSPGGFDPDAIEWRDLEGLQEVPSRAEWGAPRNDHVAPVRDVHVRPGAPGRLVAAVEQGGVFVSDDGGETWTGRRDGVHDDVHELRLAAADDFVAATGRGLYRTRDAGRTWTRLDGGVDQRYFRAAVAVDGVVYAAGALANSSTWNDEDAAPALFACRTDGSIDRVDPPADDEMVAGLAAVDGDLLAATHRGSLLARRSDGWTLVGEFPVSGRLTGRYTPVARHRP